jgi:membrane-bound lytic murein transglycosylase A
MRRLAGVAAALALLAGCARVPPSAGVGRTGPASTAQAPSWPVPPGPGPALTEVQFEHLPGWGADHLAEALPAFIAGCGPLLQAPNQPLGGIGAAAERGGFGGEWRAACTAARAVPPGDEKAARAFFETNFQPYGISSGGSANGLFTGYYEPEMRGSLTPSATYQVPIYRRPPGLEVGPHARPFYTRAEIDRGVLRRRHLELLWLADPIDAFFLSVQGAGRVVLPDGRVIRVTYDGQNGRPYVPIGRVLVDRGEMTLDQVSMQSIRAWLVAHPKQAEEVMERNPSYVFFKFVDDAQDDLGPPGALGVPLSPLRSVAVDKAYVPLGAPVWVATADPLDGSRLERLMVAQDLGGAIRGPIRADIFFGWGRKAEQKAGRMREQGMEFVLLPRQPQTAGR